MKRLSVLRHAKSSGDEPDLDDFDRPLNDRGSDEARRLGQEMKRRGFRFDLVLASPAVRVRETIEGVQKSIDFDSPVRFEQPIYLGSGERLLGFVRNLSDAVERPLLVGHNPGLQRLLTGLTLEDHHRLRDRVARKFPTCAFAMVELPVRRWAETEPGCGQIVELITPKELD